MYSIDLIYTQFDLHEVDKLRDSVSLNASSFYRAGFAFVCFYGTLASAKNMVEVKITDDIKIGGNNPCFIIAEVGQNHQGDIEIAKQLIKAAKVSIIKVFNS